MASNQSLTDYASEYAKSVQVPAAFWADLARKVSNSAALPFC